MNWTIYGIECVVAIIVFTCVIMIPLCRNPIWWIHDYPQDIQDKYFENHERIPTQVFSAPVLIKKCFALFLTFFNWYDHRINSLSADRIYCVRSRKFHFSHDFKLNKIALDS